MFLIQKYPIKPNTAPYTNPPTASSRNNFPTSKPIELSSCEPTEVEMSRIPEKTTTPIPSLKRDSPSIFI